MQTPDEITKPNRHQDVNALLFSALCHLSVLIALGLLSNTSESPWGRIKLLVDVAEGDAGAFDETPLVATVELQVSTESSIALAPIESFDAVLSPAIDAVPVEMLDMLDGATSEARGNKSLSFGGSGEGNGSTGPAATEFFGIGGYGQAFVYVVDCSDSMNEQGKFDRARYELLQSIERLSIDQRYFIIFFNDIEHPMEGDQLVWATQEQLTKTTRWVQYAEAFGGTNPLPALLHAISLRPDAVYFLSDGQFDPSAIRVLRYHNQSNRRLGRRRIPIHTIAFVDRSTQGLMRTIARDSGGEYRFVK